MTDWKLDDFEPPKSRDALRKERKTNEIPPQKTVKEYRRAGRTGGRVTIYMTYDDEMKIREQAANHGMSAARFGRQKLGLDY